MSADLQYSVLTRLLALNNQVHDLENQLLAAVVPLGRLHPESVGVPGLNQIADLQEQIDRGVRASLTTCWLATHEDYDD